VRIIMMRRRAAWLAGLAGLAGAAALLAQARRAMSAFEDRALAKLKSFVKLGYCIIDSKITPARKRKAWLDILLPHLIPFWQTNHEGFQYRDSSTHPCNTHGKYYNMSCHDSLPGLPRLVEGCYEAQLLLALLLDPSCKTVHFGKKTHFLLKMRIRTLWAIFGDVFMPRGCLQLEGDEQSWHIVVFPSPVAEGSRPVPSSVHIDGGLHEKSYEYIGLPFPCDAASSATEALMATLLQQLCIIFYCETPGVLTASCGATGVLPRQHLSILQALRGMHTPVPWKVHRAAMKRFGAGRPVQQLELGEGECALVCGLLPHTAMFATTLMDGGSEVRVMQNLKVAAMLQQRMHPPELLRLVRALPADSPLRLMCQDNHAWGDPEAAAAYRQEVETEFFSGIRRHGADAYSDAEADRQTYETLCEAITTSG